MRRFQISFHRLGKVHWVFTNSEDAARFVFDALKVSMSTNIEVLDNQDGKHPKTPAWSLEKGIRP
jgi:hypothetical protein